MDWSSNNVIAWSIAVAAVAFAVLCIYLIGVLKTAQRSLVSAKQAVDEVKETIDGLQGEIKSLTRTVNEVSVDVKGKLQATDPLFDAVKDVGLMLRDVTGSARDATHSFSRAMRRKASELDSGAAQLGWLRWAALGYRMVNGLKQGWQRKERQQQMAMDNELLRRDMDAFDSIEHSMNYETQNKRSNLYDNHVNH